MTLQIVFLLIGGVTLTSAILTVTARNLVHAALWLVVSLFGTAALFALLEAEFLAVVQVVLYVGAIAILIIFAVMLTRRLTRDSAPQANSQWWLSALVAGAMFTILAASLTQAGYPVVSASVPVDSMQRLGMALVDPQLYAVPFEVASVLLVAALVGAVVIAGEKKEE